MSTVADSTGNKPCFDSKEGVLLLETQPTSTRITTRALSTRHTGNASRPVDKAHHGGTDHGYRPEGIVNRPLGQQGEDMPLAWPKSCSKPIRLRPHSCNNTPVPLLNPLGKEHERLAKVSRMIILIGLLFHKTSPANPRKRANHNRNHLTVNILQNVMCQPKSRPEFAQTAAFVHKRFVFVHFVWSRSKNFVFLRRISNITIINLL
jgi:hypothetical protein